MQQRMPKAEHSTLGLWCDLWLGSLFCSIWSFIDLSSQSWGLGKIRHSERSRYCDGVLTDFRGKGVDFLQKPLTEPRNVKKIQPQKLPRSFLFFPVGEGCPPQMNFSSFGSLGCEIKGVSRDFQFFYDYHNFITTCFQQKHHWTKMIKKITPNQQVGESHGGPAITSKETSNSVAQLVIRTAFEQKILARMFGQSWTASWDFTRLKPPRKRWCR